MLKTIDYSRLFADATVEVLATFMEQPAEAATSRIAPNPPRGLERADSHLGGDARGGGDVHDGGHFDWELVLCV